MGTSVGTIKQWIEEAQKEGATYLIVVCDTFDYDDYPVAIMGHEDIRKQYKYYNNREMSKVMEVYNLSKDIGSQLKERRAFNF